MKSSRITLLNAYVTAFLLLLASNVFVPVRTLPMVLLPVPKVPMTRTAGFVEADTIYMILVKAVRIKLLS